MKIELSSLSNRSLRIQRSIHMVRRRQPADGCFYARPVDVNLLLSSSGSEFKLRGSIDTLLLCRSHRSLKLFEIAIDEEIDLSLIPRDIMHQNPEVELDSEDLNVSSYVDVIDICDILDEQIHLALPMKLISPDEADEPELSYRTAGEQQMDSRLLVLQEIKDRMMKSRPQDDAESGHEES